VSAACRLNTSWSQRVQRHRAPASTDCGMSLVTVTGAGPPSYQLSSFLVANRTSVVARYLLRPVAMRSFVCPSVCISVCLFICLSARISTYKCISHHCSTCSQHSLFMSCHCRSSTCFVTNNCTRSASTESRCRRAYNYFTAVVFSFSTPLHNTCQSLPVLSVI